MLITEQSLVETLDGRAGDRRRGCRLFIPHQAVFIPNQLVFSPRLFFSHPADRWRGEAGHPAAGVKGNTVEWSSNRSPPVRAVLATGIIGGMPERALTCAVGMALRRANCIAAGGLADGAAPAQAVGTENTPTNVAEGARLPGPCGYATPPGRSATPAQG